MAGSREFDGPGSVVLNTAMQRFWRYEDEAKSVGGLTQMTGMLGVTSDALQPTKHHGRILPGCSGIAFRLARGDGDVYLKAL